MVWPFGSSWPESSPRDVDGQTYDYVIVGGGTAGCVLAARLSEDPSVRVLVFSRGPVRDSWLTRPPFFAMALDRAGRDNVTLEAEPHADFPGRGGAGHASGTPVYNFTSAAVGGATRVNALMWTVGAPANYNAWAADGNDDWGWEKCAPVFRRIEDASRCHPGSASRGQDGPVVLRQRKSPFLIDTFYTKAAQDLGIPVCKDANDPDGPATGYFNIDTMVHPVGQRLSALHAYLPRRLLAARRGHLTLCTNALVTRLETDDEGSFVTGVRFVDASAGGGTAKECFVKVNREAVVCGGAMFSPQILMLSGIGPREELEKHGIPVIHDIPSVGQNLSDHVSFGISVFSTLNDSFIRIAHPFYALWEILTWLLFNVGIFSWVTTFNCMWFSTRNVADDTMAMTLDAARQDASAPQNLPDVEFIFVAVPFDYLDTRGQGFSTKGGSGIYVTLTQPFSRGRIALASADPFALPRMHHPLISDPRDWVAARKAARYAMHLLERSRHESYAFRTAWYMAPGVVRGSTEGTWRDATDEQIDDYIRRGVNSTRHATSTCRMAPKDKGGVVGQDLKVHGLKNLRVADASVFPRLTSGHTVAPVFLVAERCADFIKRDWGVPGVKQKES